MDELSNISNDVNPLNSSDFIRVISYGDKNFDNVSNFKIKTATIKFIKTATRFEVALLHNITDLLEIRNNVVGEYR